MFIKLSRLFFIVNLILLTGCSTHQKPKEFTVFGYMGDCGNTSSVKKWRYVNKRPINTMDLAKLANEKPILYGSYAVESWFESGADKLMLCRTDQAPQDSCTGAWWVFEKENDKWVVSESNGWICFAH